MLEIPADTQIRMILNENRDAFGDVLKPNDPNVAAVEQPGITTGWYDYQTSRPQITITNPDEGVSGGGETGYTGGTGAGGVSRIWTGYALVGAWVQEDGLDDRVTQAVHDAGRASAKQVSYMLAKIAADIVTSYAGGYPRNPGQPEDIVFRSMGVDSVRRPPMRSDDDPDVKRYEFAALFNHADRTDGTGETTK